jgi:undecaprenyl-diphosphatase
MDLVQTLILAIIQGVTEWLPISSSGHLAIAQAYFNLKPSVAFSVMLHVGTLLVVLIAFRNDLTKILKALTQLDYKTNEGKLAVLIAVGNVPTALIGFLFREVFKSFFDKPLVIGTAFIGTGCILYVSRYGRNSGEVSFSDAFLIGVAQGIALIPGVSRSGITIATGLISGVKKEEAFKFSFLLSIPAVIGALILESGNLLTREINELAVTFGVMISIIVGYVSLKLLRKLLLRERFHQFAFYCWLLGVILVAMTTTGLKISP